MTDIDAKVARLMQMVVELAEATLKGARNPELLTDITTKSKALEAALRTELAAVQGEPVAAMIDMSKSIEQMPDGSHRPIYKTGLFTTTPQPALQEFIQAITDPENQPSQYGTVTLDYHLEKIKEWEDRFDRAIDNRIEAASAKLEGDAKDAERYRWLRSIGHGQLKIMAHYAGIELDKAIDEAIASQKATQ